MNGRSQGAYAFLMGENFKLSRSLIHLTYLQREGAL